MDNANYDKRNSTSYKTMSYRLRQAIALASSGEAVTRAGDDIYVVDYIDDPEVDQPFHMVTPIWASCDERLDRARTAWISLQATARRTVIAHGGDVPPANKLSLLRSLRSYYEHALNEEGVTGVAQPVILSDVDVALGPRDISSLLATPGVGLLCGGPDLTGTTKFPSLTSFFASLDLVAPFQFSGWGYEDLALIAAGLSILDMPPALTVSEDSFALSHSDRTRARHGDEPLSQTAARNREVYEQCVAELNISHQWWLTVIVEHGKGKWRTHDRYTDL